MPLLVDDKVEDFHLRKVERKESFTILMGFSEEVF